jgi:hypothetical protein
VTGLLLALVLLVGVGDGFGWLPAGPAEAHLPTPLEAFGAPGAGHAPIALTGPRSIALAPGLNEARPRAGQFVEPAIVGLAHGTGAARSGLASVTPGRPHLAARGLLTVRAPPA